MPTTWHAEATKTLPRSSPHLQVPDLSGLQVLNLDAPQQPLLIPVGLLDSAVPDELNLWVVLGALLHDLGGTQRVTPVNHVDL